VQKDDLKWLLATRKEYIRCYYLHLAVDNICENKDRIKVGKETIDNCINSWGKNRAVAVPGEQYGYILERSCAASIRAYLE